MKEKTHQPVEIAKAVLGKYLELLQKSEKHEDKKEDEKLIDEKIAEHEEKCEKCDSKECKCSSKKMEKCGEVKKLQKFMDWRKEKKQK